MTETGAAVVDDDGVPIDINIDVTSGSVDLQFEPDADFTGAAKIRYVVVDPQDDTFVSPISEITVNVTDVNDAPIIRLSPVPSVYTQGQDASSIFSNVSVTDIDSTLFSEIRITTELDADDEIIAPAEIFGMVRDLSEDATTITYAPPVGSAILGISAANVSALLSNIKFVTSGDNLVGETRDVTVTVTDVGTLTIVDDAAVYIDPVESISVTKTVTLIDVNDGPKLVGDSSEETFTEGDTPGVAMSAFGSIEDPEGDNISQVTIHFDSGYKLGQDNIGPASSAALPDTVETEFDEATGSYSIAAVSADGLTAAQFDEILAQVYYSNASSNPQDGATKELALELFDVSGQSGLSSSKTITLVAQNDNPEVFAIVSGAEQLAVSGAQFVAGEDPTPVRVAPSVSLRDVDGNEFASATVTAASATAVLSLSVSGEQLRTAYNLTLKR